MAAWKDTSRVGVMYGAIGSVGNISFARDETHLKRIACAPLIQWEISFMIYPTGGCPEGSGI